MSFISGLCAFLIILCMFFAPITFVVFLILLIKKSSRKKIFGFISLCLALAIIPLSFVGAFTDPATWCEHQWEVTKNVEPTCTDKGYISKYCPLCEDENTEYIDERGHDMEEISRTEATCLEKGEVTKRCTVCGIENVEIEETSNHSWVTDTIVPADCINDGYVIEKCTVCLSEQESYGEKAVGHDMVEKEKIEPTCTEGGRIVRECSICGHIETIDQKATGHSMTNTERIEPTEEREGKIINRCSTCNYETITILDKLPADYVVGVDFATIYRAYKANELRADDIYKNNRYRITAKVNGMSSGGLFNLTGGATLTMEVKVDNTIVFFYAEFEKEQEKALKTINVGDTITFEGECLSAGSWVECEIIK